ncbi:MAG: FecR family protein [Dysgonomonas sp.]|nr:FecR family protein [Dysgonomonas sp.]
MNTDKIKIAPRWEKSKDEIWDEAFAHLIEETTPIEKEPKRKSLWFYAAASVAAIIILLPSIAFFYTKNEVAGRGNHMSIVLPDDSKVNLNAESEISYKPLWWYISRDVNLNGEAYFEVEKGSTFNVHSNQYTVSVLGTSFNVFSRADKFTVTCLTGKVNVSDKAESVILTPNMQALWNNKLIAKNIENAGETIDWKEGKFVFISVPLKEVIQEIERQYDIEVQTNSNLDYLYSGNFTKTQNPNDVLQIVGKPFGIEFKIK